MPLPRHFAIVFVHHARVCRVRFTRAIGADRAHHRKAGYVGQLPSLDQIAAAGGTSKAILIDPTKNVQEAFLTALDTVRKTAIPCDYDIPASGSGVVDPTKVNVTYNASTGVVETFGFVGTADQCAKAAETGYYFDDPAAPKKVVLCPNTCERVKADDLGGVNVVFGCARLDVK